MDQLILDMRKSKMIFQRIMKKFIYFCAFLGDKNCYYTWGTFNAATKKRGIFPFPCFFHIKASTFVQHCETSSTTILFHVPQKLILNPSRKSETQFGLILKIWVRLTKNNYIKCGIFFPKKCFHFPHFFSIEKQPRHVCTRHAALQKPKSVESQKSWFIFILYCEKSDRAKCGF